MKYLITGCNGLIGCHLAALLVDNGEDVVGAVHKSSDNIDHLKERMAIVECDFTAKNQVRNLISEHSPDVVFHLAAQSLPVVSWKDPEATLRANLLGALYLLDAIHEIRPQATLVLAGSSAEYSFANQPDKLFDEHTLIEPSSPYGVSKAAASQLAVLYGKAFGLRIIRVRPLFVIGPGRGVNMAADFASQIARLEKTQNPTLKVGNLGAIRDLLDVRDAARALLLLAQKGNAGDVYNLCAGQGYEVRAILDRLLGMSEVTFEVVQDPDKFRPLDIPKVIGSNEKLRKLGWEPEIPIEKTLGDILDFWREFLEGERLQNL